MKRTLELLLLTLTLSAVAREKVILDTDMGGDVDDALALAYLLRDGACDLLGVTVEAWGGNGPRQAEIVSAICRDYGRDVPIAIGPGAGNVLGQRSSRTPKRPPRYWPVVTNRSYEVFGPRNDAVDFLQRTIRANPGEVTVVAVGHFTNLGALFGVDPEIPALIKRLVVMGGDLTGKGEWNASYDPVATAAVFANGNHARVPETLVVGADVTFPHHLTKDGARRFFAGIPALALCAEAAEFWLAEGHDLYFHDPIAAAVALRPGLATWTNATVAVSLPGGRTTFDVRPDPNRGVLKVATCVDFTRFRETFLSAMRTPLLTVSLTFDDALRSHLTDVAPLLEKHGMRGLFCVPTDWVGRAGKMTWTDLRELKRRGHEIVPHGATHTNLVALLRCGEVGAVRQDLRRAREAFERELGETPRLLCLPFNACDAKLAELIRAEGMEPLTTLRPSASSAAVDRAVRLGWRHVDLMAHGEDMTSVVGDLAARQSHLKVVPYGVAHPAGSRCTSPMRGVLCLTFDDSNYGSWRATQPVFGRHGATATFYAMNALDARQVDELRFLRSCGHTVGLHTMHHGNVPAETNETALAKWADFEVLPQWQAVRAAKLPVYTLAYPNNRHTPAMDDCLVRRFGFTHFRAGARVKYAFTGEVTADTVQRFDTVDDAFKPVEWCFWKPVMNGLGLGPIYCYSKENVFRAIRRAAERNEIVTFFSHSISPGDPDWIGAKTQWIEDMLTEADRLGVRVLGFDDLGRQSAETLGMIR